MYSTEEGDFSGLDECPGAGRELASLSTPFAEGQMEIPPPPPEHGGEGREKREATLTSTPGTVTQVGRTVNNP